MKNVRLNTCELPVFPGHCATMFSQVNNNGRPAQASYITCLSCTVNECIPDFPRLVSLCACQQCEQVKGQRRALLQGETLFTPPTHTHTKKPPVFTTNLPCISRPNTAALASGGRSSPLVTWPHSAAHNVKHKDGSVLAAHKQPHCLMSGSGFIFICGAGRPGWWWWWGLRFSGGGRQYRPLVLFPSNAAQGLGALQPRSPLDSQSSGGAALPGRAEEVGCTEPTAAGSNSHIVLLFPCSAASGRVCVCVCVLGVYLCVCGGGLGWERIQKTPVGSTVVK